MVSQAGPTPIAGRPELSQAQIDELQGVVTDAAARRVVAGFLTEVEVPVDAVDAPAGLLQAAGAGPLGVDDTQRLTLFDISARFRLTREQTLDSTLSAARALARRAASLVMQLEDLLLLWGVRPFRVVQLEVNTPAGFAVPPALALAHWEGGTPRHALVPLGRRLDSQVGGLPNVTARGEAVANALLDAVDVLNANAHVSQIVAILPQRQLADLRSPFVVGAAAPHDLVTGVFDGGLTASAFLPNARLPAGPPPKGHGVVFSAAPSVVDVVVAQPLTLAIDSRSQRTVDLVVSERRLVRVKDRSGVVHLRFF